MVGGGNANVVSSQSVQANVNASGIQTVASDGGTLAVMSTAATGNSGESNIFDGGALTGTSTQTVGAFDIKALSDYRGALARVGGISSSTQAVANSQGYGVEGSSAIVTANQSSAATTQADGGGNLTYTGGTVLFSALGTSNNVTATGDFGSAVTVNATQSMTGAHTQATVYAGAGNAQDINAQATTTGNNISATNSGPGAYLQVNANQTNTAFTFAEANLTSFEFGSAQANAYGVGNSVMAGNVGQQVVLNNTQVNSGGGVEVIAGFTGDTGYDAYASATAIGNAATGFACSSCNGRMTVTNSQTNSAEVGATGGVAITTQGRNVSSVASATGNSGTFYVSSPSQ